MQIKTVLVLGAGIGIGTLIGMCVNEDTKCKWIGKVKKKLIFSLSGEKWEPKKVDYTKPHYTTYRSILKEKEKEKEKEQFAWTEWQKLLYFDNMMDANDFMWKLEKFDAPITIHDLFSCRGMHCDYISGFYGWTVDMLSQKKILHALDDGRVKIVLPKPILLKSKYYESNIKECGDTDGDSEYCEGCADSGCEGNG